MVTMPTFYTFYAQPTSPTGYALQAVIEVIGGAGLCLGVPVALFCSIHAMRNTREQIKIARKITRKSQEYKTAQLKALAEDLRGNWLYIGAAFVASTLMGLPIVLVNLDPLTKQHITEFAYLIAPTIAVIVTQSTEAEAAEDASTLVKDVATDVMVAHVAKIGTKLATADATMQDTLAVEHALNGDLVGSLKAQIKAKDGVTYFTITEICKKCGKSPSKDEKFRRRITGIVGKAYQAGKHEIIMVGNTYKIPAEAFGPLFSHLLDEDKAVETEWKGPAIHPSNGHENSLHGGNLVENLLPLRPQNRKNSTPNG
jgi:hypothetical protein